MKDLQNSRALTSAEDFARVKRKLERRLQIWRMTVIAGAAMAALVPAAVFADTVQVAPSGAGGGILQTIRQALATLATHTTQIASLQATDSTQNVQLAQLHKELQDQNAQIAALQAQLNSEAAARAAGDAAGKTYTDAETARARAAEGALATSVAAVDNSATLAAARGYTDAQVAAEAAARQAADSSLQDNINAEVARAKAAEAAGIVGPDHTYTDAQVAAESSARLAGDAALGTRLDNEIARAQGAEASLTTALDNEIARAQAGELAAFNHAVGKVEADLTTLAKASSNPNDFVRMIADGLFG